MKLAKEQKRIKQQNRENEKEAETLREQRRELGYANRETSSSSSNKAPPPKPPQKEQQAKAPPKHILEQEKENPPREVKMAIFGSSCSSGESEPCGITQEGPIDSAKYEYATGAQVRLKIS